MGGKNNNLATEYVLKVLGLDVCADTLVGSDMVRGISGGQKKRVTTGFYRQTHHNFFFLILSLRNTAKFLSH